MLASYSYTGIRHRLESGQPCGPGVAGADAPVISLRLRFLSPGCCLPVFSLCSLLLQLLLRFPFPGGQRHKQLDGPLRLPGIAWPSSPSGFGPDGQGLRQRPERSLQLLKVCYEQTAELSSEAWVKNRCYKLTVLSDTGAGLLVSDIF